MWETIKEVLISPNASMLMATLLILTVNISVLSRRGILSINTKGLTLGADIQERDIIRQQIEYAHTYISGVYAYIQPLTDNRFNGYFTRFILETVFAEVVNWISFNHIKIDSDYISVKQAVVKYIVYSYDIDSVFRSSKFEKQIDGWVEELIKKLATIREVYNKK